MSIVTHPEKATKFSEAIKAWKSISQQIAKKSRDGWTVVEFNPNRFEIETKCSDDAACPFDWDVLCNMLCETFKKLLDYMGDLTQQLNSVEAELCDCEHACEFLDYDKANSDKGFALYQMIHDRRINRRFLKNEYRRVNAILTSTYSDLASGKLKDTFNDIDNQVYEPRALRSLFVKDEGDE